jgi:hypothetical protein
MTREAGWYWVKNIEGARWYPVYFDGSEWLERHKDYPDEFYFKINETRILPPDEPSKVIELIKKHDKSLHNEYAYSASGRETLTERFMIERFIGDLKTLL